MSRDHGETCPAKRMNATCKGTTKTIPIRRSCNSIPMGLAKTRKPRCVKMLVLLTISFCCPETRQRRDPAAIRAVAPCFLLDRPVFPRLGCLGNVIRWHQAEWMISLGNEFAMSYVETSSDRQGRRILVRFRRQTADGSHTAHTALFAAIHDDSGVSVQQMRALGGKQ